MDGKQENNMSPRRAALLIAAIGGMSAGATAFVFDVLSDYWPELWGGHSVALMATMVLIPGFMGLQKELLKPLFRWTGFRLVTQDKGAGSNKPRDTGFGILLLGGMFSIFVTEIALSTMLPGGVRAYNGSIGPIAFIFFMASGVMASAEVFPDQNKDAVKSGKADETRRASYGPAYRAGLVNLCFAVPLFIWLAPRLLAAPVALAIGLLLGLTMGAVLGIAAGASAGHANGRLLAIGLLVADLTAVAVTLPAAWAVRAWGYADSDWLPPLAMLAAFFGMTALTGFTAERLMRGPGGAGKEIKDEANT